MSRLPEATRPAPRRATTLALAALLVALVGAAATGRAADAAAEDLARAAVVARLLPGPDFELLGLDGRRHRLSDYRGKVVLVNFWATWCTSCRGEIPGLEALHRELADQGVVILGIATDEEGAVKVAPYAAELGMEFPVLLDPGALSPAIFGGLEVYPTTFILDRQGLIYSSYLGAQDEATFREDLVYLLDAPPSEGIPLLPDTGATPRR